MIKEENVYEEDLETEDVAAAKTEELTDRKEEENASTVLGKFKDVDALAKAYTSLQAEFTRRSQRLKKLEKAVENRNFKKSELEGSGAEKLRKNAEVRRKAAKEFDEFVSEVGKAALEEGKEFLKERSTVEKSGGFAAERENEKETFAQNGGLADKKEPEACQEEELGKAERIDWVEPTYKNEAFESGVDTPQKQTISVVATGGEASLDPELLFDQASRNEKVRLRIIAEYLDSIGKSGAPLTSGSAGIFSAPPVKAKSIGDAGDMALRYFRKPAL